MSGLGKPIIAVAGVLLTVFIFLNVGLSIGDRFMTSDSLAINQTTNPEGYQAQQQLAQDFTGNTTFISFLVFIMIAAAAIYIIRAFGLV